MTPDWFHTPEEMSGGVSQMICGGPPPMSTRFSLLSSKYAMERLSDDQKGDAGIPGTRTCGVTESSDSPTAAPPFAAASSHRPSGEIEMGVVPAGRLVAR